MPDQKIDNLLNLAMDATPQERRKSGNLNVGYDPATRLWDVIIKYSGPESGLAGNGIQVVPLLGGYAVVTLPESEIDKYSHRAQVEFMEKPKRLYFELFQAKGASCIRTVQTGRNGLTGKGILTGIVDSGVDYFHPDFRNADGSSRILRLWDQSIQGNPPQGYVTGTEYTKEQIDEALALGENQGRRLVPSVDYSGHGTSVLGIAAGKRDAKGFFNPLCVHVEAAEQLGGRRSIFQKRSTFIHPITSASAGTSTTSIWAAWIWRSFRVCLSGPFPSE